MASVNTEIKYLKGVGENRARLLNKLGVTDVDALLHFVPREYKNLKDITSIFKAQEDQKVSVKAKIISNIKKSVIRKNMTLYKFYITDGTAECLVTIFNNRFLAEKIKRGDEYIFYGKFTGNYLNRQMSSPEIFKVQNGIVPVYRTTAGLYQGNILRLIKTALEYDIFDALPEGIRQKYRLLGKRDALKNIHFPENEEILSEAKRRLIFEELFVYQLMIASLKHDSRRNKGIAFSEDFTGEFIEKLPFALTSAQKRVIDECVYDTMSGVQMNRLVQGDVGSGKTVVAAAEVFNAVKNGFQAAVMAPTEILAEQHFKSFKAFFENEGIRVELLTSSVKPKERARIYESAALGETDVIIGTQALLQENLSFKNLGFIVTDEQHRFGVAQRAALASKGASPHTLVMSATPIPRTLALIIYGDLDISIIDELPKGRIPIETYCVNSGYHNRLYSFIRKNVSEGRQAYIVCPLVEEGETELLSAEEYYKMLKSGPFSDLNVGLLHGKMKPKEKADIIHEFYEGKTDILVSTTVIEVGIDVPNATVMVIENAERFGLSQLHQLRGRIGRGDKKSTCIIVSDSKGDIAKRRFKTFCATSSGFEIADEDLKLRGPGDFLGRRQHGLPKFRIADLECDMDILRLTGMAANELLKSDPELKNEENRLLLAAKNKLFADLKEIELN